MIINPAGYGHTSVAILDALQMLKRAGDRSASVQHPSPRALRNHSYVSMAATGIIIGLGAQGYLRAVDAVAESIRKGKKK